MGGVRARDERAPGGPPRPPAGAGSERLDSRALLFGSVFAAINLGRHEVWLWPGGRLWPAIVGLVMIAAGIALRAWSIATLGRFFQYRIQVQLSTG